MKYKIGKYKPCLTAVFAILMLSSCLKKNDATYLDFSQLQDQVILKSAGLSNFKASNLRVDNTSSTPDSVQIYAQLASVNASSSPVNVTIGVDNGQIATYNAANNTKFQPFPAGSFKLLKTALTIAAGNHYTDTYVVLDQTKFDPTVSYMLPISITDASGKALSTNQNTIFFNVIGNPIAGNYNWDFTRWNNTTGTGTPAGSSFTANTATFIADDPVTVEMASGYYIQPRYVLTFTNTNGVLSNFKVSMNPDDVKSLTTAGVTITDGPNIIKADPVKGEYIFQYATTSRYLIDRYYK